MRAQMMVEKEEVEEEEKQEMELEEVEDMQVNEAASRGARRSSPTASRNHQVILAFSDGDNLLGNAPALKLTKKVTNLNQKGTPTSEPSSLPSLPPASPRRRTRAPPPLQVGFHQPDLEGEGPALEVHQWQKS